MLVIYTIYCVVLVNQLAAFQLETSPDQSITFSQCLCTCQKQDSRPYGSTVQQAMATTEQPIGRDYSTDDDSDGDDDISVGSGSTGSVDISDHIIVAASSQEEQYLERGQSKRYTNGNQRLEPYQEVKHKEESVTQLLGADATVVRGEKGEKGERGEMGETGSKGNSGDLGPPGEKGDEGKHGLPGTDGEKGEKGAKGSVGPRGYSGGMGPQGYRGAEGPRGEPGRPGPRGNDGVRGPRGERGMMGIKGSAGEPGLRGEPGKEGPPGKAADSIANNRVAFLVRLLDHMGPSKASSHVIFSQVDFNAGRGYDPSSGSFLVTFEGVYIFHLQAMAMADHIAWLAIQVNGEPVAYVWASGYLSGVEQMGSAMTIQDLRVGDVVNVVQKASENPPNYLYAHYTLFSGYILY